MGRIEDALRRAAAAQEGNDRDLSEEEATGSRQDHHVVTPAVAAWNLNRFQVEAEDDAGAKPRVQGPTSVSSVGSPNDDEPRSTSEHEPIVETAVQAKPAADGTVRAAFSAEVAEKLVVMKETNPIAVEQYRKLAATLHHLQLDRRVKVVMITSAMSGEGKTLTAANLALTLSESYQRRVLLVDADLRRPGIQNLFQIPVVAGLTDILKSAEDKRLALVEVSPRLVLLPAGRPDLDPMSILTSDRMRRIISEASAAFDWVIVDSPPVVHLPDANLLAAMVDLAVLVAAAGKTSYLSIARAVEMLGADKVVGIVLNQVDESTVDAAARVSYANLYVNRASAPGAEEPT